MKAISVLLILCSFKHSSFHVWHWVIGFLVINPGSAQIDASTLAVLGNSSVNQLLVLDPSGVIANSLLYSAQVLIHVPTHLRCLVMILVSGLLFDEGCPCSSSYYCCSCCSSCSQAAQRLLFLLHIYIRLVSVMVLVWTVCSAALSSLLEGMISCV